MKMDPQALLNMLRTADLGGTIGTILRDPNLREDAFRVLGLPPSYANALRGVAEKEKPTAGEKRVPTVEEYAQLLCDLGIPPDQSMMAAMADKGEDPVAIAVYLGKKYPKLQISPQVVRFMIAEDIIPRIKALRGTTAMQTQQQQSPQQQAPTPQRNNDTPQQ